MLRGAAATAEAPPPAPPPAVAAAPPSGGAAEARPPLHAERLRAAEAEAEALSGSQRVARLMRKLAPAEADGESVEARAVHEARSCPVLRTLPTSACV